MSLMPIRPPGRRTRAISANTARLSAARLTTQLLMTTSIDSAGRGSASMWPLRNSTLVAPAWAALRLGEGEHLVGHVDPERATGRPDPLGGQEDVDAATGAEVEDALARVEVGDGGRVAAAERREDRGVGQLVALERGVEVRADRLGIAATRGALGGADRGVGVVLRGRSRGWSRWSSLDGSSVLVGP